MTTLLAPTRFSSRGNPSKKRKLDVASGQPTFRQGCKDLVEKIRSSDELRALAQKYQDNPQAKVLEKIMTIVCCTKYKMVKRSIRRFMASNKR